jgi:hypothetical protein
MRQCIDTRGSRQLELLYHVVDDKQAEQFLLFREDRRSCTQVYEVSYADYTPRDIAYDMISEAASAILKDKERNEDR